MQAFFVDDIAKNSLKNKNKKGMHSQWQGAHTFVVYDIESILMGKRSALGAGADFMSAIPYIIEQRKMKVKGW
jgi:hypothetical protein